MNRVTIYLLITMVLINTPVAGGTVAGFSEHLFFVVFLGIPVDADQLQSSQSALQMLIFLL